MIPAAAFDFLWGLAANNEKPWFEANRATYESAVREPVAALAASGTTELTKRGLPLDGDPKRSMFRLHRDTRFSNNKAPYKTNVGVVWYRRGQSKGSPGVLYFHLDPAGCLSGRRFGIRNRRCSTVFASGSGFTRNGSQRCKPSCTR